MLLVCLMLMPSVAKASDQVVEKVTVSMTASQTPPARIGKRMSASVGTVGEQMLVGRNVNDVATGKDSYEKLIQEIFDRVLVGYSVQSVRLVPAANTVIQVAVAPWGDVVHDVDVTIDVGNISPELADLLKKDIGNMEEQVNEVLVGLPIDAVDWAGGVSKIVIREALAAKLPEFSANFDIIPGPRTTVKLSLTPLGATIQDVHVSLRSHTIPNLLLTTVRPTVAQASKSLVGLPVAFVERHREYFTAKVAADAAKHHIAKDYGLAITPVIYGGVDTEIALDVETDKYKVTLEGYMDMGRSQDNTSFRLHAGKFIGKRDEAFVEADFIPSTVAWKFVPGWGHAMGPNTTAGIKYNMSDKRGLVWLRQDVGRNVSLRLERTPSTGDSEFAVRYKMHDFVSAEYIITKDNKWLRLIGNL